MSLGKNKRVYFRGLRTEKNMNVSFLNVNGKSEWIREM